MADTPTSLWHIQTLLTFQRMFVFCFRKERRILIIKKTMGNISFGAHIGHKSGQMVRLGVGGFSRLARVWPDIFSKVLHGPPWWAVSHWPAHSHPNQTENTTNVHPVLFFPKQTQLAKEENKRKKNATFHNKIQQMSCSQENDPNLSL